MSALTYLPFCLYFSSCHFPSCVYYGFLIFLLRSIKAHLVCQHHCGITKGNEEPAKDFLDLTHAEGHGVFSASHVRRCLFMGYMKFPDSA